ncbi:MAG: hypothetical protein IPK82_41045 [Polyangiaceae bacterium]|nr:hypothetical protein [Polyangiaceae bacterium]
MAVYVYTGVVYAAGLCFFGGTAVLGCGNEVTDPPPQTSSVGGGGSLSSSSTGGNPSTSGSGGQSGGTGGSTGGMGGQAGASQGGGGASGGSGGGADSWSVGGPLFQAACDAYCWPFECSGAVCAWTPDLRLRAVEKSGPSGPPFSSFTACNQDQFGAHLTVVVADGECALLKLDQVAASPPQAFDAGVVTAQTPTAGLLTLSTPAGACLASNVSVDGAFSENEAVEFTATGGVTYPSFAIEVSAPGPVTLAIDEVIGGQPALLTWTPDAPPNSVTMTGPEGAFMVCVPSQPSGLTLSPNLTSAIASVAGDLTFSAYRTQANAVNVGPSAKQVVATAASQYSITVAYQP